LSPDLKVQNELLVRLDGAAGVEISARDPAIISRYAQGELL
jgi:hypothetical protein